MKVFVSVEEIVTFASRSGWSVSTDLKTGEIALWKPGAPCFFSITDPEGEVNAWECGQDQAIASEGLYDIIWNNPQL